MPKAVMKTLFHVAAALLLLLVFGATSVSCRDDGYANSPKNGCLKNEKHTDWMASIPSRSKLFRDLTVPGTHDSGSWQFISSMQDWQRTQCSSVESQLEAGVRLLDLRLSVDWRGAEIPREVPVLAHGKLNLERGPTATAVWDSMIAFLEAHPYEVIIAFVRHEYETPWNATTIETFFNEPKYKEYRDTNCLSADCAIGPSRGKIVYLTLNDEMNFLGAMDYKRAITDTGYSCSKANLEDTYDDVSIRTKWDKVRANLREASEQDTNTAGYITYVSASAGRFPYFFASGRSSPIGPALSRSVAVECDSAGAKKNYDMYFVHCTCESKESSRRCMLAYKGMNTLLYEWLGNGLDGNAQHPTEDYIFPRHLGMILTDFPSNSLIRRIIDVNFAAKPSEPTEKLLTSFCGKKCACMSNETPIMTRDRGVVGAGELTLDDVVEGTEAGSWCRVLNTTAMSTGTVYGNFTADHLLVHDNGTVMPNGDGDNTTMHEAQLINVFTECPAARTAAGVAFTPLSTTFCADALTWSEYTVMYAALMRIVNKTGSFWFDPSVYMDGSVPYTGGDNESELLNATEPGADAVTDATAAVDGLFVSETFTAQLPSICKKLVTCAMNGTDCETFESTASQWMGEHLPEKQLTSVKTVYKNLGLNATTGTLTADVLNVAVPPSEDPAPSDTPATSDKPATSDEPEIPDEPTTSPQDSSSTTAPPATATPKKKHSASSIVAIVVPVVVGVLVVAATAFILFCVCRRRQRREPVPDSVSSENHEPVREYLGEVGDYTKGSYCAL